MAAPARLVHRHLAPLQDEPRVGALGHLPGVQIAAGGRVQVRSAGSEPADRLNPAVVQAIREVGIDLGTERPKLLTDGAVREADVVVTMGCGDACPFYPGKRYLDWELPDPAGRPVEEVRQIRDRIDELVGGLLGELTEGADRR